MIEMDDQKPFLGNFCFHMDYFYDSIIEKIGHKLKGVFISSSTEKDSEDSREKEKRLIKKLTRQWWPFYQIHASEHVIQYQIWEKIDGINPKLLFPLHTKYPEKFQIYLDKIAQKVIIPSFNNLNQIN